MRNNHLIELVDRTINTTTASVYAQVLHALLPNLQHCQQELENLDETDAEPDLDSLPQVSTAEVVDAAKGSSELSNQLDNSDSERFNVAPLDHPKKRRRKVDIEDRREIDAEAVTDEAGASDTDGEDGILELSSDPEEINSGVDCEPKAIYDHSHDPHWSAIRNLLLVLAMHPFRFVHHIPQTTILPERWTINFTKLMKNVTHHTLLETITSRHGLPAARLTRILFDRGKTDEKVLCSISLLAQKTMRSYLLPLHKSGMIGLQEVPRDNSRNPQRTNFLWSFDTMRCKSKILEETYKTMARHLKRIKAEGKKLQGTLEKASRSDVIGREQDFLGEQELEALNVWKKLDERIWGELSRLDDLVACLGDY